MLTIYLSTYNRLDTLERSLNSLLAMNHPYEVIIVDNGTTHPKCLELLATVGRRPEVSRIYHLDKATSMENLADHYNEAINDWERNAGEWVAVTDADVCFEGSDPHSFDAYIEVASHTGCAAGPHLRVDAGIPFGYPLRSRVLACETRMLYRHKMSWLGEIPYSFNDIDTTFHLFPRGTPFVRGQMRPARVGHPFDAKHLDWYVDLHAPTEENEIYITDDGAMGAWGHWWIRDIWIFYRDGGRAEAFREMQEMAQRDVLNDVKNGTLTLSWCHQFGLTPDGTIDLEESKRLLRHGLPARGTDSGYYWPHRNSWMRMIYDNDFSSLGWS